MGINIIPCGFLKVKATAMIKPLREDEITLKYIVDKEGYMNLAMNALLLEKDERKVLFDPGTADFLPMKLRREYGLEIPVSLEKGLADIALQVEQITDVVFTHLHFDHASGGFKRSPGNIVKRFPNVRYHVLKEHYQYALDPDPFESDSFSTGLLKYLDRIHWLEEWELDWIQIRVFKGHTRGMVVAEIHLEGQQVYFISDLLPMEIFLDPRVWCGYDLDSGLLLREKEEFLRDLTPGSQLVLYHDTLKKSVFYE